MATLPIPRFFLDCGFAAGVLTLLLQFMGITHAADWMYFCVIGGWALWLIAGSLFVRAERVGAVPHSIKAAASAFALGALSSYFLPALISAWFAWVLAVVVACRWVSPKRRWASLGLTWLVMLAFAMCSTLAGDDVALHYGVVIVACLVMYKVLTAGEPVDKLNAKWSGVLTLVALYLLCVLMFRTDGFGEVAWTYQWKAIVEPAQAVREGGWLLWDVPSLHSFLQTLAVAKLPAATTWQSLYLLNGVMLVAIGGMIFTVFFTRYHSVWGFVPCVLVAVAAMFPGESALRFFWVYVMVGYVMRICLRFNKTATFLPYLYLNGNLLWLIGTLWSVESGVFATMLWVPALVLIALAQLLAHNPTPSLGDLIDVIIGKLMLLVWTAVGAAAVIAGYYEVFLHHLPDVALLATYVHHTAPIAQLAYAPCLLFVFFLLVMVARQHIAHAYFNAHGVLAFAVLYCLIVAFTTASLPLIVYVSAVMLLLLPYLTLPPLVARACEKGVMCFYGVLVLAAASHVNADTALHWADPIHPDVTMPLDKPPAELLALTQHMPQGAQVQYGEAFYISGKDVHEWLIPNMGYETPLTPEVYKELAARRAARLTNKTGWLIEKKDHAIPAWQADAIAADYEEKAHFENDTFVVRKYQRIKGE